MKTPILRGLVVLAAFSVPLLAETAQTTSPAAKPKPKTATTAPKTAAPKASNKAQYIVRTSSTTVKRREAVMAMSDQPDKTKAGQQLIAALSDKDSMARMLAARGLGDMQYTPAREKLSQVLATDSAADVREAAAVALRQLGDPKAVDALAKGISDPVTNVRITSLMGVGYFRDAKVRPQVEAACQDASVDVRRTAVYVLGKLEDPQSIPVVEGLLKDSDASVRAVAAQTLGELRAFGSKPQLVALLKDPEKTVQVSAARSLLKLGDPAGFDVAKSYVLDEELAVRLLAIDALGWSKNKDAGKILESIKGKVPANNRMAVDEALARHEQLRKQK